MAITPKCDKCQEELLDFGGILLSPPDENAQATKYHLCQRCYSEIAETLRI